MAKAFWLGDAWTSLASVTASTGGLGPGLDIVNGSKVLDINPRNNYISLAGGIGMIQFTGPAVPVNTFYLGYTNASSVGVWRIRAAASIPELTSNPLLDTSTISIWPETGLDSQPFKHGIYQHPSLISPAAIQLDFTDANATPDTFLRIGRFVVDQAFTPSRNFSHAAGYGTGFVDTSEVTEMMDGTFQIDVLPRRQRAQYGFQQQTHTDRAEFLRLNQFYGSHHPIVFVEDIDADPGVHSGMIHGLVEWAQIAVQSDAAINRFSIPVSIREMGA